MKTEKTCHFLSDMYKKNMDFYLFFVIYSILW